MAIASLLSGTVVGAVKDSDGALLQEESDEWVRASVSLALLTGSLLLLLGLLGAHNLTRALSGAVLSGFTTGIACVIFLSQLPKLLGLDLPRHTYSHQTIAAICRNLAAANVPALLVGVSTTVALQVTKTWRQRYSARTSTPTESTSSKDSTHSLTVMKYLYMAAKFSMLVSGVVTTLLSWALHNYTDITMPIVGSVPSGLPSPQLPSLTPSLHLQLLPGAIMVAVITFTGNWAVAKKFAEKNGYSVTGGAEMIAYGLCNVVSSVFHGHVVAGGFSRSAVNAEAGAQTQLAGFISGVCMLISLQFFTSVFYYLPLATLGAIIVVSVMSMMDFKSVRVAYNQGFRMDCVVMVGTLLCTFFAGVTEGLLCGVVLSVGGLLLSISSPEFLSEGVSGASEHTNEVCVEGVPSGNTCFRVLRMSTLLYFGNLDLFKDTVLTESRALASAMMQEGQTECVAATTTAEEEGEEELAVGALVVDAGCWGHYLEMSSASALRDLRLALLTIADTCTTIHPELTHTTHTVIHTHTPTRRTVVIKLGLVNCHPVLLQLLGKTGLVEELGTEMVFSTTEDCLRHCEYRLESIRRNLISDMMHAHSKGVSDECEYPFTALCIDSTTDYEGTTSL
jgi:SulP family sulfate permease